MKLIDLTCTTCGAPMKVNPDLKKVFCNFCGHEMLIDDEVKKLEITNGFDYGYDQEKGRLKAREDHVQELKRKKEEDIRKAEEERKQDEKRKQEEETAQKRREEEAVHGKFVRMLKFCGTVAGIGLLLCFIPGGIGIFGAVMILLSLLYSGYRFYMLYFYTPNLPSEVEARPKITFPRGMEPFDKMQYETLRGVLLDAGFVNVTCNNLNDIVLGIFQKKGRVESVYVSGNIVQSGGRKYYYDEPIVINYHGK